MNAKLRPIRSVVWLLVVWSWCSGGVSAAEPTTEFINRHFADDWEAHKLKPSATCSDLEFLRRATLDVIGRIPTPAEIEAFEKDNDREKLIDRLLASDEYAAYWARLWASWLLPRTLPSSTSQRLLPGPDRVRVEIFVHYPTALRLQLETWLQGKLAANTPYQKIVEELLTATGKATENGAVNFLLANLGKELPAKDWWKTGAFDMVPATFRTIRLFAGYRLDNGCALGYLTDNGADFKQKHFWGVNAFFRQVDRKGNLYPQYADLLDPPAMELLEQPEFNEPGMIFYEKPNGMALPVQPTYLDGYKIDRERDKGKTRRQALARIVTSSSTFNPALVNRMWVRFFGRGFNAHVDDLSDNTEPLWVNRAVLDRLAKDFETGGFDLKKLIRWMCTSTVYQRKCTGNATNAQPLMDVHFSRMPLKLLLPEQLVESLLTAAGTPAAERAPLRKQYLEMFARRFEGNEWEDVPAREKMPYLLAILNQKEFAEKYYARSCPTLARVSAERDLGKASAALYLTVLGRRPTAEEVARLQQELASEGKSSTKDPAGVWQDLYWALINSSEFILNH